MKSCLFKWVVSRLFQSVQGVVFILAQNTGILKDYMAKSACFVCLCQQKQSAAVFLLFWAELFNTILLLTTSSELGWDQMSH